MKSLRVTIRFKSGVGSSLQSDTIFGQFAWWYLYIYGEDKLKEMLDGFEEEPFIVFSDGFLHGTVAVPFLKPEKPENIRNAWGDRYYEEMKRVKKARFIRVGEWLESDLSIISLKDFIYSKEDSEGKPAIATGLFIKNSVNRITNTTDAGLYVSEEYFFNEKVDIYAKYDSDKIETKEILEIFTQIGEFGFGKDKSTGKGRFEVVEHEENPAILNRKGSKFISLSSFVPDSSCEVLYGKTFTKFGKHGETLVFGNPFKNPVIMFRSGSIFKSNSEREVYGRGLRLSNYEGHYQNAFTIPLFIDMEE